jgi:hypothetical protein
MLGQNRYDHHFKFTVLRFMDGNGIGKIKFHDIGLFVMNPPDSTTRQFLTTITIKVNIPVDFDIVN